MEPYRLSGARDVIAGMINRFNANTESSTGRIDLDRITCGATENGPSHGRYAGDSIAGNIRIARMRQRVSFHFVGMEIADLDR
jgi:hypothetical protein